MESLGADKYVYFSLPGAGAQSAHLAELAADSGVGHNRYVARVSAESTAATGHPMDLALDVSKLHVFDADTGVNLTAVSDLPEAVRRHLRAHFASRNPAPDPRLPVSPSSASSGSTCCASAQTPTACITMSRWAVRGIR